MDENIILATDVTIPETVSWIKKAAIAGSTYPDVVRIANMVRASSDPLKTLFDQAYDTIVYYPDKIGKQYLRTFWNIFRTHQGNCVTYTELISAVLINLGLDHYYEVISYDLPNVYNHIYVKVNNTILDPVIGQKQDGTDTRFNRPAQGQFNTETNYKYKIQFYMPQLEVLNGTQDYQGHRNFSRSKRSRITNTYGSLQCTTCTHPDESQLGKTIVGKILGGAVDVLHGIANVLVTPIEGILHTQIVGDNYSNTGFGNFISTSQSKNSSLNAFIGNIVSDVFTGGSVKIQDVDKATLQQRADTVQQLLTTKQTAIDTANQTKIDAAQQQQNQVAAQGAFEVINANNTAQELTADQLAAKASRNKKIIIGVVAAVAVTGTGFIIYKHNQ